MLKIGCWTEYEPLRTVIVCPPRYMTYGKTKNVENQEMPKVTINKDRAMSEHGAFVKKLEENGVQVVSLSPSPAYSEAIFTRDIAFTIGDSIYISKMAHSPRKGEEKMLINFMNENQILHQDLFQDHIEGGDVIIDKNMIYVGISNRTSERAAKHLARLNPSSQIVTLPFGDQFLHLDCLFNIISPTEALIYPGEFPEDKVRFLKQKYDLIEVSTKEQESLGTNVLSIGHRKIISHSKNVGVNHRLRERGYEIIPIDFSEIIQAGGSFRCCSLPLVRIPVSK